MNGYANHNAEEASTRQQPAESYSHATYDAGMQTSQISEPALAHSLVSHSQLRGHANGSTHAAAMQRMQGTHGNRAIQRFVHGGTSAASTLAVQRFNLDDLLGPPPPGLVGPGVRRPAPPANPGAGWAQTPQVAPGPPRPPKQAIVEPDGTGARTGEAVGEMLGTLAAAGLAAPFGPLGGLLISGGHHYGGKAGRAVGGWIDELL